MNKSKFIFKVLLLVLAFGLTETFAQSESRTENRQPPIDPCYEVVLQIVVASNAAGQDAVPPSLAGVVKKLGYLYNFSNYRLTTTFLQRTSGTIEYKSLLSDFAETQDRDRPVFANWSLRNLRSGELQGRRLIQFDGFHFGARVPVTVQQIKNDAGGSLPVVNYEQIGISSSRFSVNENEPTVVGSLAAARPDELLFLVLTIRAVQ